MTDAVKMAIDRIKARFHPHYGIDGASDSKQLASDCQALIAAIEQAGEPVAFQQRVQPWMMECFGETISGDMLERADRFTEEALELAQTMPGFSAERAHALVDYVFGRDVGERKQEVGGVMVTLAALCLAAGEDMHDAGETELARISQPHIVEKIRAKQSAKPTGSALPVASPMSEIQRLGQEFDAGEGRCGDKGVTLCQACSLPAHELTQSPGCGAPSKDFQS